MAERVQARLSASEGRRFGAVVGGAFLVLAAVLWWRGRPIGAAVPGVLGVTLALAALLVPTRLGPVRAGWMKLAELISRVTTPVFMTLIFVVALLPMGLLVRLFGHRPLVRKRSAPSFWAARERGHGRSDLRRQF